MGVVTPLASGRRGKFRRYLSVWVWHGTYLHWDQFSSLQFIRSVKSDSATPWTAGFPVHHQLPEFTQTPVHWVGDAIQPSHPLSSLFSSRLQSFSASESFPMSWLFASGGQKYRSFSISPSDEYSGIISSRIYWLDLLAVHLYIPYIYAFGNKKEQGLLPWNACECFGSQDQHRTCGMLIQSGL